jgi:hypothetical protein
MVGALTLTLSIGAGEGTAHRTRRTNIFSGNVLVPMIKKKGNKIL